MNILLNFFPVRAGGGQQVASNFIKIISNDSFGHKWFIFVGEDSELHRQAQQLFPSKQLLVQPYSYKARLMNRNLLESYIVENKIDIIYNYAPILPIKGIPQVVRTVYSNLYFPEINFWGSYPFFTRIKKKAIDYFRLRGTLKADGLVFENKSMQDRAGSLFKYDCKRTVFIQPSVTLFDESNSYPNFEKLMAIQRFKILYLSSWHLNKNIHILPFVAKQLKQNNVKATFILSLDINNPEIQELMIKPIKENELEDYFEFIGRVEAKYVHQVVKKSDALILLSKLECFSSNIIEAYTFQKIIFIADEPWSRAVCEDAGIYVQRDSYEDIAEKIGRIVSNKNEYETYVANGERILNSFNTPKEKVKKQVEFLEFIKQLSS